MELTGFASFERVGRSLQQKQPPVCKIRHGLLRMTGSWLSLCFFRTLDLAYDERQKVFAAEAAGAGGFGGGGGVGNTCEIF